MMNIMFDACPDSAPFFGFMGIATAVVFASASRISHVALLRILAEPSMLTRKNHSMNQMRNISFNRSSCLGS
jgi:hypothetical protein